MLKEFLQQKRLSIIGKWLDLTLETYPAETSKFFKGQQDKFSNPVGSRLQESVPVLFDNLLDGINPEQVCSYLNEIIKIRSIQEFTPSQSISFIFSLKEVVREELKSELINPQLFGELIRFEKQIDQLALFAIDILVRCREQVYELRVNEVKRQVSTVLKRSGMFIDDSEPELNH